MNSQKYFIGSKEEKLGNQAFNDDNYEEALNQYTKAYDKLKEKELELDSNVRLLDEFTYLMTEIVITRCVILDNYAKKKMEWKEKITGIDKQWKEIKSFLSPIKNCLVVVASNRKKHIELKITKKKETDFYKFLSNTCEQISDSLVDDLPKKLTKVNYNRLTIATNWIKKAISIKSKNKIPIKVSSHLGLLNLLYQQHELQSTIGNSLEDIRSHLNQFQLTKDKLESKIAINNKLELLWYEIKSNPNLLPIKLATLIETGEEWMALLDPKANKPLITSFKDLINDINTNTQEELSELDSVSDDNMEFSNDNLIISSSEIPPQQPYDTVNQEDSISINSNNDVAETNTESPDINPSEKEPEEVIFINQLNEVNGRENNDLSFNFSTANEQLSSEINTNNNNNQIEQEYTEVLEEGFVSEYVPSNEMSNQSTSLNIIVDEEQDVIPSNGKRKRDDFEKDNDKNNQLVSSLFKKRKNTILKVTFNNQFQTHYYPSFFKQPVKDSKTYYLKAFTLFANQHANDLQTLSNVLSIMGDYFIYKNGINSLFEQKSMPLEINVRLPIITYKLYELARTINPGNGDVENSIVSLMQDKSNNRIIIDNLKSTGWTPPEALPPKNIFVHAINDALSDFDEQAHNNVVDKIVNSLFRFTLQAMKRSSILGGCTELEITKLKNQFQSDIIVNNNNNNTIR